MREYLLEKQALLDLSQDEMAKIFNVPSGTLSRWLSGYFQPSLKSVRKIANGLGVPVEEVIEASEGKYQTISKQERESVIILNNYEAESILKAFKSINPEYKNVPDDVFKGFLKDYLEEKGLNIEKFTN